MLFLYHVQIFHFFSYHVVYYFKFFYSAYYMMVENQEHLLIMKSTIRKYMR